MRIVEQLATFVARSSYDDLWADRLVVNLFVLTLLYSARDTEHNNAVALKAYLEQQLKETTHG